MEVEVKVRFRGPCITLRANILLIALFIQALTTRLQLSEYLVNILFDYITITLLLAATLGLVAFIVERRRNKKLEERVKFLERRLNSIKKQLEYMQYNNNVVPHSTLPQTANNNDLDSKILELYLKGYSYGQIAKQLGISKSTVYRRLKKLLKKKTKTTKQVPTLLAT